MSAKNNTNIEEMFKSFYTEIYFSQKVALQKKHQDLKTKKEKRIQMINKEKDKCCN